MGVDLAVSLGLSGTGQVIGMLDSGPPDLAHCFFVDPGEADPGPNHRKIVAVHNVSGTAPGGHSTFTSGIAGGDDVGHPGSHPRRGLAWGARLVCGNRLDLAGSSTLAALGAAGDSGALTHSNSWHACPQGVHLPATYDRISVDVDTMTWLDENQLVLGSSGNTGEEQGLKGSDIGVISRCAMVAADLTDDDGWRRYLMILLDGLRARPDVQPLPDATIVSSVELLRRR